MKDDAQSDILEKGVPGYILSRLQNVGEPYVGRQFYRFTLQAPQPSPTTNFKKVPNRSLIPPIADAFVLQDKTGVDYLYITTVVLISEALNITQNEFIIKYNLSLYSKNTYQLNVYVIFNKKDLADSDEYLYYPIEIYFGQKSIFIDQTPPAVNVRDIGAINIFLVDTDPKTSRGTMTTVQKQHSK